MELRVHAGGPLALGAAALALGAAAPAPAALHTLATTGSSPDPFAPLVAALALAAWALLAWLMVVAALAAGSRGPGAVGRGAAALAQRTAPAAVRRLVEASLGLTLVAGALGPVPASADTRVPPPPPAAALDWPTPPSNGPSLDWSPAPAPTAQRRPEATVVVQPGDSLWAIAADHLPADASEAQVAQSWPAWWTANRAAIGPDPDLIHPGLALHPPTSR